MNFGLFLRPSNPSVIPIRIECICTSSCECTFFLLGRSVARSLALHFLCQFAVDISVSENLVSFQLFFDEILLSGKLEVGEKQKRKLIFSRRNLSFYHRWEHQFCFVSSDCLMNQVQTFYGRIIGAELVVQQCEYRIALIKTFVQARLQMGKSKATSTADVFERE